MKNKKVWVVGEVKNFKTKAWSIVGIYSTEKVAAKKCKTENYFIGAITLDGKPEYKSKVWKEAYYPVAVKNLLKGKK